MGTFTKNRKAMRKAVFAVGLVLITLGLPVAVYYASILLTDYTFSPDIVTRFQLTEALGASLAFLGAVLEVGGLIRAARRKIAQE